MEVDGWSRKCQMLTDPLQKRRMRALTSLPGWLERIDDSEKTYENYHRMFQACMTLLHLTDGVYNQQSVSVQLVTLTRTNVGKRALLFGALLSAARDFWKYLDQYRVPKFLFLIRLVVSEMLFVCIDASWDEDVVRELYASLGFVMPICNLPRVRDAPNDRLMSTAQKESLLLKHLKATQWDEDPETENAQDAQIDLKKTEYYKMNLVDTSRRKKRRKGTEQTAQADQQSVDPPAEWHPEWFTDSRRGVAYIDGAIWHQCISVWFEELQKQLSGSIVIRECQEILNDTKILNKINRYYSDDPAPEAASIYVHPDAMKSLAEADNDADDTVSTSDSEQDSANQDESIADSENESGHDGENDGDDGDDASRSSEEQDHRDGCEPDTTSQEQGSAQLDTEPGNQENSLSLQQFVALQTPIFRALAAHTSVEATWVKFISVFDDFLGRHIFYGDLPSFARSLCVWHIFLEKLVASGLIPATLSEKVNKLRVGIHQKMLNLNLNQVPFDLGSESLDYIKQIACTHSLVRANDLLR